MFDLLDSLGTFMFVLWLITIIITIAVAVHKGYNGFLAFLLGLFVPLLGSTIIILLLPDNNYRGYSDRGYTPLANNSNNTPVVTRAGETKKCSICGESVDADIFTCPKCGNESFK